MRLLSQHRQLGIPGLRQATQNITGVPATTAQFAAPAPIISFNQETNAPQAQPLPQLATPRSTFPPAAFANERISIAALRATGLPIEENDFLALGGGMGSFTWVDTLRCFGVKAEQIVVLGWKRSLTVVTSVCAVILKFHFTKGSGLVLTLAQIIFGVGLDMLGESLFENYFPVRLVRHSNIYGRFC